jgi:hypothetical protein
VTDGEIIGHWQNKGWSQKTAEEIAVEATRAHREAERFVGAPANQIIRLPADAGDAAGWNAVWSRLGKPADAKDYKLGEIKHVDEKPIDPRIEEALRTAAHSANLPVAAASSVAQAVVKALDAQRADEVAQSATKLATEKATLEKNWGTNVAVNKMVAAGAAKALGVSAEAVAALENVIGYAQVMEMFRNIGSKIGEDKFILPGAGAGKVMSADAAKARRAELMADTAWVNAYLAGDHQKAREMAEITAIIVG